MDSATSIIASTIPTKSEPDPQEPVPAQLEAAAGGAVSNAETHLWAAVEEKQGSESAEEKDGKQEEEGGVTGG